MTEKLLLRPDEAADAIGVSRAKAYELIAKGDLPSVRIGGSVRVPLEGLKRWVSERTTEQTRRVG